MLSQINELRLLLDKRVNGECSEKDTERALDIAQMLLDELRLRTVADNTLRKVAENFAKTSEVVRDTANGARVVDIGKKAGPYLRGKADAFAEASRLISGLVDLPF